MRSNLLRRGLLVIAMFIGASLYYQLDYNDISSMTFLNFAYGLDEGVLMVILLRWYFIICLIFAFVFHHYKNEVADNKVNTIIRYKSKTKYNLLVLKKGILKGVVCWTIALGITGLLNIMSDGAIYIAESDALIVMVGTGVIIVLTTLLVLLDAIVESLYAYIIVNGFVILSVAMALPASAVLNYVFFPVFLMGVRFTQEQLLFVIPWLCLIEVLFVSIYIIVTKKKDMMR